MQKLHNHIILISSLLLALFTFSCRQQPQLPSNRPQVDEEQENLMTLNKAIVNNEDKTIEQYIAKNKLSLKKDSLGFWCSPDILKKKAQHQSEQIVTYQYSIRLLDGRSCYSNLNSAQKTVIRLGKGESFRGLDLAIRKMKVGEQADFIFPSILAFGVSGDGHQVPPYSILACTVKLLNCENKK